MRRPRWWRRWSPGPTGPASDGAGGSRGSQELDGAQALEGAQGRAAADHASRDRWRDAREWMVREQLQRRGIADPELLRAFRAVHRDAFVESDDPYGDHALAIGAGQTISQPYVVAVMAQAARPTGGYRGARVLEIGTGSGYSAAILAEMGATVTTIERHASLAGEAQERLTSAGYGDVRLVVGDGSRGDPEGAPYDAIIVTAAGPSVPEPLTAQLSASGGRLVMPVGEREQQWLTIVERQGDRFDARAVEPVVFVPLVGEHGFEQ